MIWTLAQVALGGAVGAAARYLTQAAALRLFGPGLPWGTFAANLAGSFLIGFLALWLAGRDLTRLSPFLVAGVLGGYTTFSTFALDSVLLWQRGMQGAAAAYVAGSVILSIAAALAGMALARVVPG
ncbi:MAG: fluoride efflux transporter CrcB [Rhodobacteraceae bacterium]|jgi:CrcB protein|nr:fluoride efflux transporter CrcB [Paracoccaceae bacterium]